MPMWPMVRCRGRLYRLQNRPAGGRAATMAKKRALLPELPEVRRAGPRISNFIIMARRAPEGTGPGFPARNAPGHPKFARATGADKSAVPAAQGSPPGGGSQKLLPTIRRSDGVSTPGSSTPPVASLALASDLVFLFQGHARIIGTPPWARRQPPGGRHHRRWASTPSLIEGT